MRSVLFVSILLHYHKTETSTDRPAYQNSSKAVFLFGERLDHTGQTRKRITGGPGGSKCKDALQSVVVNRVKLRMGTHRSAEHNFILKVHADSC